MAMTEAAIKSLIRMWLMRFSETPRWSKNAAAHEALCKRVAKLLATSKFAAKRGICPAKAVLAIVGQPDQCIAGFISLIHETAPAGCILEMGKGRRRPMPLALKERRLRRALKTR